MDDLATLASLAPLLKALGLGGSGIAIMLWMLSREPVQATLRYIADWSIKWRQQSQDLTAAREVRIARQEAELTAARDAFIARLQEIIAQLERRLKDYQSRIEELQQQMGELIALEQQARADLEIMKKRSEADHEVIESLQSGISALRKILEDLKGDKTSTKAILASPSALNGVTQ